MLVTYIDVSLCLSRIVVINHVALATLIDTCHIGTTYHDLPSIGTWRHFLLAIVVFRCKSHRYMLRGILFHTK